MMLLIRTKLSLIFKMMMLLIRTMLSIIFKMMMILIRTKLSIIFKMMMILIRTMLSIIFKMIMILIRTMLFMLLKFNNDSKFRYRPCCSYYFKVLMFWYGPCCSWFPEGSVREEDNSFNVNTDLTVLGFKANTLLSEGYGLIFTLFW